MTVNAVEDSSTLLLALAGHAAHTIARLGGDAEDVRVVHELAARGLDLDHRPLDVNRLVHRLEPLLAKLMPDGVDFAAATGAFHARVVADRGVLEAAVVGLVLNAAEATEAGGRVFVETANVRLTGTDGDPSLRRLAAGVYVLLAIGDTGAGMAPADRDRALRPLFTTKAGHAGLGLPTIYAVVQQLGGALGIQSEPGRGTSVKLYLPLAEKAVDEEGDGPAAGRGETVLVVDDTDSVRRWTRQVLEQMGYRTLEAASGVDALELARQHDGRIDLVVTDVVMPELDGLETIAALAEARPETRYVLMSGYTESRIAEVAAERYGARFLQKPFSLQALCGTVRESLDSE